MTIRFMVSVAALALIAGTGMANAQGMGKESGGSAAQHSAPADISAAPSKSDSSAGPAKSETAEPKGEMKGGMKSTQSEQKQPGAMKNERAEDNVKGGSTSQRAEDRAKGTDTKGADTNKRADDNMKNGHDNNMKAEGRDNNARDNNMKAEGKDKSGTNAAETKSTTERTQTTGQAGAGAKLTSDQRTKISTVIKNQHVENVTNVNFSVSIGTRVPRENVHFYPVPAEIVTIYPQWRGYEFIMVNGRIVIVEPSTYEIVEIIES
jgi:Protein of unknown function (DUF1236)